MKRTSFALSVAIGFSALALMAGTALDETTGVVRSGVTGVSLAIAGEGASTTNFDPGNQGGQGQGGQGGQGGEGGTTPPEKKDKPEEGGGGGGGETGPTPTIPLTGVLTVDGATTNVVGETFTSTTSDENVILAKCSATLSVSNCTMIKTGDYSSEDQSNFFSVNAVVTAQTNAMIYVENSKLFSDAKGANGLFASGSGSTIYAYGCTISSTNDSSRGLDATYKGKVIASKMSIETVGKHCAAFATDRGNGSISVTDSTASTAGEGSPIIYSTGVIEVNSVTGTSSGAQIAGIEGLSTIRIRNSGLTGSGLHASEPLANGVLIYQSGSGDYTEGTATFEVSDSTLKSTASDGAMFYVTHSAAYITVQNTTLDFDTDSNSLVLAAGNNGEHGWGTAGSNGAEVVFTAIDQTLAGKVTVDGISSLDMYLTNSTYTGTFVNDTTYTGDGDGIELFISGDSTWTVTSNCTLKSLTAAPGATIRDGSDKTVSIYNSTSGKTVVTGTGALTITVSDYITGTFTTTNITAFEIDRNDFEERYPTSQGGTSGSGGSGGGAEDHDGWVYYFKPHPPDNAIVKVLVDGAADYGLPDKDHKYCLDGYWDGSAENGVNVMLLYVTQEGYLFSDGCKSNTWNVAITNNAQEVYPPEDIVAIKAQAKSGATYYLTLREAIEKANDRARIMLTDNVTLEETLTVTNSITLDLCATNVLTLGSALTPAFLFTARATVSNGTITSSLAADAADSVFLRFTNRKSTLSDVRIAGDGCLLYVDDGATVTLTNGCAFTCNTAASVYCSSNGTLVIAGDTCKGDGVVMAAPEGFHWEKGTLVSGELSESVAPGTATDAYDTAQSATNAAAQINANKADCIAVPSGVEGTAKATYLTKVEATVTGGNCVVIDLTPAAAVEEQELVDSVVTSETAVVALVSTNAAATATIATTTPGLYYWIEGGTDAGAVSTAGEGVLSTDGGAVELSKPALDWTKGRAFFKIAAGVAAP